MHTGSWGLYGLLTWLPSFFQEAYSVDIADLGAYTLAPYVVQGGIGAASGIIAGVRAVLLSVLSRPPERALMQATAARAAGCRLPKAKPCIPLECHAYPFITTDRLLAGGRSVRSVRRVLQVAGMLGPAACLVAAASPLTHSDASVASSLITVGLGMSALTLGGVSVSHLDVAPRHAGVIFAAGNTAATLAGLLAVPFTGVLLQATHSWLAVFGVTALHYVVGAVVWARWLGGEPLPQDG